MAFHRKIVGDTLLISDDTGASLLEINERIVNDDLVINVSGDIKSEIAHEFEDELLAALTTGNSVVVDLSSVNYISSAGLRALLSAQQMVDELGKSSFYIQNLTKNVIEIFRTNGFLDLVEIKQ